MQSFLAAGFPVYVVDAVERGRAGWCALEGEWEGEPIVRSEKEAWRLFRFGKPGDFAERKPFPGQRFPVEHLAVFACQFVPRWTTTAASIQALTAAVEKIGPCIVLCHSQGGDIAFQVALDKAVLVRGMVAIEPSGFPDPLPPAGVRDKPYLLLLGDFLDAEPTWTQLAQKT